jgi:hypothetical protein
LHDGEIAKEFGCSSVTIWHRRKLLGLKANMGGQRPGAKHPPAPRRAARQTRLTDGEGTVTVQLSGTALDTFWNSLSLEVKGEWIGKILGD